MLNLEIAGAPSSPPPRLARGPVVLRPPQAADYSAWVSLRSQSRAHLTKWEPDWREAEATAEAFRARVRYYEREQRRRSGVSLFALSRSDEALVGAVTLSDVRYQSSCSATIGYWIGEPYLRRGFGLAAVEAMIDHAFSALRLNRIEAACQPGNVASRALLARAGFREEGFAADYLFINGAWRDHMLFALTARDYCGAPTSP